MDIEGLLVENRYIATIDNPVRDGQQHFVMSIRDYTWVVPFVIGEDDHIVLKTAFRSRKYHKIYGGSQ